MDRVVGAQSDFAISRVSLQICLRDKTGVEVDFAAPVGARRLALVEAKTTRTVLPRMGDPMRLLDPTGDYVTALRRNRSLRLAVGRNLAVEPDAAAGNASRPSTRKMRRAQRPLAETVTAPTQPRSSPSDARRVPGILNSCWHAPNIFTTRRKDRRMISA